MSPVDVRPVRPEEWRRARDFRLEALQDEMAGVAFLTTYAEAAARPDEVWRLRALAGSEQAGAEASERAFIAVDGETWLGTLTVFITEAGAQHYTQHAAGARVADVVAVYVAPAARGRGVVQALLEAAAVWAASRGVRELQLFVHEQNPRARRAYEKSGFTVTAGQLEVNGQRELRMLRPLRPQ